MRLALIDQANILNEYSSRSLQKKLNRYRPIIGFMIIGVAEVMLFFPVIILIIVIYLIYKYLIKR